MFLGLVSGLHCLGVWGLGFGVTGVWDMGFWVRMFLSLQSSVTVFRVTILLGLAFKVTMVWCLVLGLY